MTHKSVSKPNECDGDSSARHTRHSLADKVSGDVSQTNKAAALLKEQRECESLNFMDNG